MNNILVPFDFSDSSTNALDYAYFLAEKQGSRITVLHVLTAFNDIYNGEEHLQAIKESILVREMEIKDKLDSHIKRNEIKSLDIKTEIINSISVPAGIMDFLENQNFNLVIMGTHGKTGISKWLLGSVSEKIIKLSKVPVLTIHKDWLKREVKTMLIPVDFSEGSRIAAKQAINLFAGFHAKLKFIFVIEEDDYPDILSIRYHFDNKENQKLKNEILNSLEDFTGIPSEKAEYIIQVGQPHEEINKYAEKGSIDLTAMPVQGQGMFDKILIGSTTDRTIRTSPCPVLSVPFSMKNTSKIEYHMKFTQFLARYNLGKGLSDTE